VRCSGAEERGLGGGVVKVGLETWKDAAKEAVKEASSSSAGGSNGAEAVR